MNVHDRFHAALDHASRRGMLAEQARQASLARGVSPVLCEQYKEARAALESANRNMAAATALL